MFKMLLSIPDSNTICQCQYEAYTEASISATSSSGSSMFSQNVEPDLSADEFDTSSPSASFDWDANLDRSHCTYPGMGLRVANV